MDNTRLFNFYNYGIVSNSVVMGTSLGETLPNKATDAGFCYSPSFLLTPEPFNAVSPRPCSPRPCTNPPAAARSACEDDWNSGAEQDRPPAYSPAYSPAPSTVLGPGFLPASPSPMHTSPLHIV